MFPTSQARIEIADITNSTLDNKGNHKTWCWCRRESYSKCPPEFNMMFLSIIDLNTENDGNSTFLILIIDPMQQPEKTLKYDKNTKFDMQKWIQVSNSCRADINRRQAVVFFRRSHHWILLSYLGLKLFLSIHQQMEIKHSKSIMNVEKWNFMGEVN